MSSARILPVRPRLASGLLVVALVSGDPSVIVFVIAMVIGMRLSARVPRTLSAPAGSRSLDERAAPC